MTLESAKTKPVEKKEAINPKDGSKVVDAPEEPKLTGCEKCLETVWSIRYKKRTANDTGELYIKTTLRNLFLYVIFLVIISIIVYGMVGLINFYFSSGMLALFVDQSVNNNPVSVTFRNGFNTYDDVWNFLQTPLMNGLYFDTWYDLTATTSNNLGYIFYQNKILGSPRIMQVRVRNNTCKMSSSVQGLFPSCIASYSSSDHSEDTFGKGLTGISTSDLTYTAWQYAVDSEGGSYSGKISTYPSDGFMINLSPTSRNTSLAIIQDLMANKWIDQLTRAVIIDFTVYNGNVNLFNQMRLVMEFPASGGIINSWTVRTSKLLRYVSSFDYFVAACECLFVLFIIYYTIEEILDIRLNKLNYFKDPYNIMDSFILILSYVTIGFNIYRTIQVNNLLDKLLNNNSSFENFDTLTYCQELFNQASAIVIFFSWIKIFKYISLNQTLDQLNGTLRKSAKDVVYFCVIFFIVFFAYAALGYLLFGETLPDYQTYFKTLFTLFRIILGDFDFLSLRANFPVLGPIFFISFVFIGFFILLNMFMAIINQSYQQVKEEMEASQPEFMLSDYLKLNYARVVDKLNLRRNRIIDIEEILKSEEISNSDELEYSVFRKEMRKKGYVDMEIEAIFAKYDRDCDRKLNELEKIHLVREVARARNHLSDEFKNFKETRSTATAKDGFEVGNEHAEEEGDEQRKMTRDDFDFVVGRIDRLELSVASIIKKIDKLFGHLENMEVEKMKKRQEIAKLLSDQTNTDIEQNINDLITSDS